MPRRKKRRGKGEAPSEPRPPSAPRIANRPFADALAGVEPAKKPGKTPRRPGARKARPESPRSDPGGSPAGKKAPSEPPPSARPYEDRVALEQAYMGVRPLSDPSAPRRLSHPSTPAAVEGSDEAARARLDALVSGGVRFRVTEDEDGRTRGLRVGLHESHVRTLDDEHPTESLDLHGLSAAEAERALTAFVREHARRGERVVRIVHGKGSHSAGGVGVLRERTIRSLTGASAAFVAAFATASPRYGGLGALLVRLVPPAARAPR